MILIEKKMPISISEEGRLICVSEMQPLKALLSIDCTGGGIVMSANDAHFSKRWDSIDFFDVGNKTFMSGKQPEKSCSWNKIQRMIKKKIDSNKDLSVHLFL